MNPLVPLEIAKLALQFANSPAGQKLIEEMIADSNKFEARMEALGAKFAKLKWFDFADRT